MCTYYIAYYATEDSEEYSRLMADPSHEHIIYTDHENIPDMERIKGTLKIAQVQGNKTSNDINKWAFETSYRPCSCSHCSFAPLNSSICVFKEKRNIEKQVVSNKKTNDDENDEHGLKMMTVEDLKTELRARGLAVGGRKEILIERLQQAIVLEAID